ncbi:lytic transglycosylase domain-containing protein [Streptomyces sp. 1331.2]|uniref:lytic transglycosylase domain-containing protein n=1 Tax=Streptomyces sp. 1331.2 TaxID=1938835 RepID=UPI000BC56523|nr:lytic transglycosylase domain-containing protein [Streptomyces sp. 1331.2]SOB80947.1 Transglycosylase SLT domain-containing protein [Streptomyces sp. 1331.2]
MRLSTTRRTLVLVSAAAVSAAVLAGCGTEHADKHQDAAAGGTPAAASAAPTETPSASPSASAAPSPSASASASSGPAASQSPSAGAGKSAKAAPSTPPGAAAKAGGTLPAGLTTQPPVAKPVVVAPVPSAKPGPVAPPPPPAPPTPHVPPLQSGCTPSKPRPDDPKEAVGAALAAAAGQSRTLKLSSGGTDQLPPLPVNLVKAIAWQESGWQSGILACDGGIGTMQVMPNTISWMNGKFGTTSDANTLAGNVQLGSQLLDWLVAYYGDSSFGGKYDLSPDPATGKTPLLDLVVSAYNAGAGNVHYNAVTDPTTSEVVGSLSIPNPGYVANVKALMSSQPWNKAG